MLRPGLELTTNRSEAYRANHYATNTCWKRMQINTVFSRTPKNLTPETPRSTKSNFRFAKGRKNPNESISFDPAIKKRGPVSQFVDLDETQIQFD